MRSCNAFRAYVLAAALSGACGHKSVETTHFIKGSAVMTRDQIINVAREDAKTKYRDLSVYEIETKQDGPNWHVVFKLKDNLDGGGPEYVIDTSGKIISKKYYQ